MQLKKLKQTEQDLINRLKEKDYMYSELKTT